MVVSSNSNSYLVKKTIQQAYKMRAFIIVCLLAAATANLSGYTYNRATGGAGHSTGFVQGGGFVHSTGSAQLSQPIQQQQHHYQQPQQHYQPIVQQEVNKEFYTFTAPEEEFSDPQIEQEVSSVNKRNLQVIFIHAPEQAGLNRAVQNFAQQTLEQQTAIYVLTKQADIAQLTNNIQRDSNHVAHKPEVHFVKYKTPEDAARAQQSIRAQYDALGGSSSHSDGGVAPVINFVSQQKTQYQPQQQQQPQAAVAQAQAPAQTYLPITV